MTYYIGAWMGYGFHEDGLKASINLVNLINLEKMIKEKETNFSNCLYEGEVFHSRQGPKKHNFKYKVFCINFNLCKANSIFKNIPIFSINKFNIFSFFIKIMDQKTAIIYKNGL